MPSTNALPFAVSAIFAGIICANASELAQITAVAAMAANVLDVMAEYLPLVVQTRVSATTNPTTRIYSRSGAVLRENRTSEALPRCAESILDNGLDGCYDAQGVLGKIMRRRLEVFIPIVLLSILVQMVAPIAAFRMVAFAASDPALAASICHDSAASADTQTAISYATLAVVPIQRYASQYGPNSVSVWPVAIPYTAMVQGGAFGPAEFEGWVDDVAQFMRSQQVPAPCIVIMHNRSLPNSPSFTGQGNSLQPSHHSITGSGTPYCYSLVFDENLSIADNNHTVSNQANEKVYAHTLSHEIAEMVVDPRVDDSNPEVCDACSTNCNPFNLFELFDQNGGYMGGTADTGQASGFAFFINSIVRPGVVLDSNSCLAQGGDVQSACTYPPPVETGQLLSYGDAGTPGNVSDPVVVGFGGWLDFKFLFSGTNVAGENRIYAVVA